MVSRPAATRGAVARRREARRPALLAGLLLLSAGAALALLFGLVRPGDSTHSRTPRSVQATADDGGLRVALAAPLDGRGPVTVRLWHEGRPVVRRRLLVALSRPLRPPIRIGVMQRRGNTYQAALPFMGKGMWELAVRVPDGSRTHTVPFLLQTRSPSGAPPPAAYPLFSPVDRLTASVGLPLGAEVAGVQIAIGAAGDGRLEVRLTGRQRPAGLEIQLDMLDMPMPDARVTARKARPGLYEAQTFFSMPGIWRLRINDGHRSAAAATIIGKPQSG